MTTYLTITPHDTIIARDGRPFGAGQRMRSLDWLYPSVLAGSLRTMLGKEAGLDFSKHETIQPNTINALKNISVSGPLPIWNGRIFFPAPRDIVVRAIVNDAGKEERYAYAIRPAKLKECEGCDLPFPKGVLYPAMLPIQEEFKPAVIPAFWSVDMMVKWLKNPNGEKKEDFNAPPDPLEQEKYINGSIEFLPALPRDSRIHVEIDPALGSSKEGMLFRTEGLDFSVKGQSRGIQLAARVEGEGVINGQHLEKLAAKTDSFCTLGGERRLVHWKAETMGGLRESWSFQEDIHSALDSQKNGNKRIRLVLATPAIFNQGWLPGWLKFSGESIEGVHKEIMPSGIKLKLVSACIGRWKPISGWSLEKSSRGPKKIRRLVPSGSIYFFEVVEGDAKVLVKNLWMRSVCDEKQDRLDGFGLALWGVWDFLE